MPYSFRRLFIAMGVWLMFSPVFLYEQHLLLSGTSDREALALMAMGFVILVVSGFDDSRNRLISLAFKLAIAIVLLLMPGVVGFDGHISAELNAYLSGVVLVSLVTWEFFSSRWKRSYP